MKKARLFSSIMMAAGIMFISPLLDGALGPNKAAAQGYRNMTCGELWYARNAIFARQGYCFKTARARQVFGPRCYAPWGRLTPGQQRRVDTIVYWERRFGCRR
ncbi:YARHG domain-containing protein [Cohaesibacter marisflavi]|uniref:YARHG domain-containing protein n=1 Tax=Cohaesibacter marisflavi TaxID=655353 RepID=UPI0029C74428|nr:YARHG domain-containing protein [Cohaesibacter marisflavi]